MIKPTAGRVVWFYPTTLGEDGFAYYGPHGTPLAATIAHVWNDRLVNLSVTDSAGKCHSKTSVQLLQDGDPAPSVMGHYCEWMPFQKGQAVNADTKALGGASAGDTTGDKAIAAVLAERGGMGWALDKLKAGAAVRRAGWNGKGMWLALQVPDANSKMSLPYIYMRTVDDKLVPWLASQTDLLADDWAVAAA